jgi:hypothetical protein
MYETKLETLLQPDDVLRADGVRAPQRFVKVFAVPATKFRCAVVNEIKWATALEHTLELAEFTDVTTRVKRHFDVGSQAEPDLVGLVLQIAGNDVMTAAAKFADQPSSNRA